MRFFTFGLAGPWKSSPRGLNWATTRREPPAPFSPPCLFGICQLWLPALQPAHGACAIATTPTLVVTFFRCLSGQRIGGGLFTSLAGWQTPANASSARRTDRRRSVFIRQVTSLAWIMSAFGTISLPLILKCSSGPTRDLGRFQLSDRRSSEFGGFLMFI